MRAMELRQPGPAGPHGPLHAVERPPPEPATDEVLIDVTACAVCRTDLQIAEGDLAPRRLPIVPGHQVVGRVAAHGAGVGSTSPPLGARVGVAWIGGSCGRCRFCATGRENLCPELVLTGWSRDGGFAEQMTVRADFVHRLPEDVDDLAVAPLLCGGAIGYRALRLAGGGPGSRLGLYGFGASATCVIQLARHEGRDVLVATRSPREQERARRLGARWAGGYGDTPPVPLDAAITFAPVGDVVVDALRALDRGGTVVINAIHLDRVPEFPYDLLWLERSLRSVANVTRADVAGLVELAGRIPITTEYEVLDLDEANVALHRLSRGEISGAAVLAVR